MSRRTWIPWLGASGYLAAALLVTFPLAPHLGSAIVSHWDVDAVHDLWVHWWFERALASADDTLFHTDLLAYPREVDLQLADLNLGSVLPAWLLGRWLSPFACLGVLALAAFVASASLTARLARDVTGDGAAAWMAGLVLAASPYWTSCLLNAWAALIHVWVLPLGLLAARRALRRRRALDGALAGAATALAFHMTPYYFVYLVVLGALLAPWHLRALARLGWRPVLAGSAVALALVLPRALPMLRAASHALVVHHGPGDTALGAPLLELVAPSTAAVRARLPEIGYMVVFIGWTLLAVLVAGLAVGRHRRRALPWLAAGAASIVLALGPHPKPVDGSPWTGIALPAAWLRDLPVFRSMTNHWRWGAPATLCLAMAFARALSDLRAAARRRAPRAPALLVAGTLAAFALEAGFVFPFPARKPLWSKRPFPIAAALRDEPGVRAVFDLSPLAKLNQTVHGKPIGIAWLPRMDRTSAEFARRRVAELLSIGGLEGRLAYLHARGFDALVLDEDTAALAEPDATRPAGFRVRRLLARRPHEP